MEYLNIALWLVATANMIAACYYELFRDDDIKVIKHEIIAVTMIVLYIGGQV